MITIPLRTVDRLRRPPCNLATRMLSGSKSSNFGGITEAIADASNADRPASIHSGLLAKTVLSPEMQH